MFQNRTNNQALMNFWEKLLQKWCHFLCSDNWLSWLGWSIQSHQIYPLFLPDDLDQHIGNKESTRNTQVNLPKNYLNSSEFEQPQISFNIKHIFHNFSSNQWSRGNCAWNEENARHRHWALGNQGRPCKWNQVPWKFPKTFTFLRKSN